MKLKIAFTIFATIALCACGDNSESPSSSGDTEATELTNSTTTASSSGFDRQTFVLCPALEDHRDELSSIVGFTQNPERDLSLSARSSKCVINGKGGDFISVAILPALVTSIEQHAQLSFDAPASSIPEFPVDAMYVDSASQPHVTFAMVPLIIDVHAECTNTPDRQTMIALATRVREILIAANQ